MENLINHLNGYVWSTPLLALILGGGLFFSFKTGFVQIRRLGEMVRLMFSGMESNNDGAGVSSFQALAMSVASRVGTGNIAGVATAIGLGGPGAVFWMWLVAILGASTSFIESTMAQIYKEKHGNEFRGGPAYYIEKGLNNKPLAAIFAFVAMLAFGACLNMPQANTIASSLQQAFGLSPTITAIFISVSFAIIVFGGLKRIASVAERIVPFMAIAYIFVALFLIVSNIQALPGVIKLIFTSALMPIPYSLVCWGAQFHGGSNEVFSPMKLAWALPPTPQQLPTSTTLQSKVSFSPFRSISTPYLSAQQQPS